MPVRHPVVAGRFYPADPSGLRRTVQNLLPPAALAPVRPHMIMLPHAGYVFCGDIIGETLARVSLPSTLILLGPNHTGQGQPLAVWPEGPWLTPLGPVETDADMAARLLRSGAGFTADTLAHAREHSLEVLLPFLQVHVPDLRVTPVAVGTGDNDTLRAAGEALAHVVLQCRGEGREVALVVSSDMNHFADHKTTLALDSMALAQLLRLDAEGLLHTVYEKRISMCGVSPATLALYACCILGSRSAELVRHGTSGTVTGDMESVVGYSGIYVCG